MESKEEWRPVVNSILYGVQFQDQLSEELAGHTARVVIEKPVAGLTAEQQYAALATAVESGTELTRLEPDAHSEQDFRNFLSMLLSQMDSLRPWPEPPFDRIRMSRWEEFADPAVIARLQMSTMKAEQKIDTAFDRFDDIEKRAVVLRLKSGTVVALVARWWPDSNHIAVVTQGRHDTDAVIAELTSATSLEPGHFGLISE